MGKVAGFGESLSLTTSLCFIRGKNIAMYAREALAGRLGRAVTCWEGQTRTARKGNGFKAKTTRSELLEIQFSMCGPVGTGTQELLG